MTSLLRPRRRGPACLLLVPAFVAGAAAALPPPATGPAAVAASAATRPAPDGAAAAIRTRFAKLQNVSARYAQTTTYTPPDRGWPMPPGAGAPTRGAFGLTCSFSYLDGRVDHDVSLDAATLTSELRHPATAELARDRRVFLPDRVEELGLRAGAARPHGAIRRTSEPRLDATIDVALGLRDLYAMTWTTADELLASVVLTVGDSGRVVGTRADARGGVHTWTWDPALGYALVSYTYHVDDGRLRAELVNGDFKEVAGMKLPGTVVRRWLSPFPGETQAVLRTDLKVVEYAVGDPANTPDRYRADWPAGTTVVDTRTDTHFVVGTKGEGDAGKGLP